MPRGVVLVIIDGVADLSVPSLPPETSTVLSAARTPVLDALVRRGQTGLLDPVSPGLACGSDTAHLALFGYEPRDLYRGRGAFEALGDGLDLLPGDVAFKCNFASLDPSGVFVTRRCVDRNFEAEARALCADFDRIPVPGFPDVSVTVKHAMKHRCGIVVRGPGLCDRVGGTDPLVDGEALLPSTPWPASSCCKDNTHHSNGSGDPSAVRTAAVVNSLSDLLRAALATHPINATRAKAGLPTADVVLLRGASETIEIEDKFSVRHDGIKAFLIAPTKIIAGVGRTVGIPIVDVEGATGDYHTNFDCKADACVERMLMRDTRDDNCGGLFQYDLGIVHIKAVDDAGHAGDLVRKIMYMEAADGMVGRIERGLAAGGRANTRLIVTGDHTTPVAYAEHTSEPVPLVIADIVETGDILHVTSKKTMKADGATQFEETDIGMHGCLGRFPGLELMKLIKHHVRC
jgi:2,3-diphosphopglycerate-independent phosphoglycerate mutase